LSKHFHPHGKRKSQLSGKHLYPHGKRKSQLSGKYCQIMQWKEQARAAESEVQRLQSHVAHLEHAARAREVTLEQLKGRLSDKVTKEERVAKRDVEAYARLKRAFLTNKGDPSLWHYLTPESLT